ncbi:MAG: GNAT family N-acetyltransferase [Rhodanobacter sp.]
MTGALLAFPAPVHPAWLETPGLQQSGLGLRPASESDLPFLHGVYASSRAEELAGVPWPEAAKRAFCESQFVLQHCHYVAHCVPAAFLIVLLDGKPVGRLYLHWTTADLRIVDIALDAPTRGHGVGTALLRWLQAAALGAGVETLSLHVDRHNRGAYRLYRRLGFRDESVHGGHLRMAWSPRATIPVS